MNRASEQVWSLLTVQRTFPRFTTSSKYFIPFKVKVSEAGFPMFSFVLEPAICAANGATLILMFLSP